MSIRQEFVDCAHGNNPEFAILVKDYGHAVVHRSVNHLSVARQLSKEFGIPGFWRLKERKA